MPLRRTGRLAGDQQHWGFPLTRKGDATGDAGEITAFILSEGIDPDESNNEATVKVKVEGTGPDLTVVAHDVDKAVKVEGRKISVIGDLHAGDTVQLRYFILNQGDAAAAGLKISVKLPKGVAFTEAEDDCEYNDANTSLVCSYDNVNMIPQSQDKDTTDDLDSAGLFYHLLSVGADVKAGALSGGEVSVEALPAQPSIAQTASARTALPANAEGMAASDVDATDNTDAYAVIVTAKTGGGGAGDGGNGGGDGGLPVTGPQAGLIGGVGVAAAVAGGVLFLAARRRRVVLVTPGDEKPTA
ncbi:LPXTG cell wall anchor domain-containing protein [Micromonospora sp. DT47]|uniref:LPXTG cell wall anchor domain-containing protein n=1 Tax=Micromonospora sp. DT47 TaxID=3393431 RepID=UPI003CF9E135